MLIAAIRTVLIYILIILAMRIMGKRQLGELQPIELVVALMISDLAAVPMQDNSIPFLLGVVPIVVLVALELLLSLLMLKSGRISRLISGKPMVLIKEGVISQKALKTIRMTVEDLSEALRQQGVFNPDDVEFALIEPNGHLSVVLKQEKQPVTLGMTSLSPPTEAVELVIVCDGTPSDWALEACGLDQIWLEKTLKDNKKALSDVFLMTANRTKEYRIIPNQRKG